MSEKYEEPTLIELDEVDKLTLGSNNKSQDNCGCNTLFNQDGLYTWSDEEEDDKEDK